MVEVLYIILSTRPLISMGIESNFWSSVRGKADTEVKGSPDPGSHGDACMLT
jgi:hypothetical protein